MHMVQFVLKDFNLELHLSEAYRVLRLSSSLSSAPSYVEYNKSTNKFGSVWGHTWQVLLNLHAAPRTKPYRQTK